MDLVKKTAARSKKFVYDHRVAVTMTLTALACLKLNKMALKSHDDFLREHDLFDKYYLPED